MKKLIIWVMVMLSIATTQKVGAQSNSEYAVSKYTLSELATGNHNTEIVNKAGMTGQAVYNMLEAYTKEYAGVNLETFVKEATESQISENHFNTQALLGGIQVYFDRTPSGHVKSLKNAHIKVECCNLVGTDPGVLKNFLAKYAKESQGQGSPAYKIGDGQSESKSKQKDTTMDINVTLKGAEAVAQQTNYGPWWLWLIGAAVLIILALIFRPGARQRFISNLRDGWAVEDEVLGRNERRIRSAHDFQTENNGWMHRESEAQRTRYRGDQR